MATPATYRQNMYTKRRSFDMSSGNVQGIDMAAVGASSGLLRAVAAGTRHWSLGAWEAWLLFFVDAVADTANQALATAQQLNRLRERDKARLAELGRQAGSAGLLLDALCQQPIANIAHLCERTGLTPATVGRVLPVLGEPLGIVHELTGQKRNRIYAYRAYIDILNQDPS